MNRLFGIGFFLVFFIKNIFCFDLFNIQEIPFGITLANISLQCSEQTTLYSLKQDSLLNPFGNIFEQNRWTDKRYGNISGALKIGNDLKIISSLRQIILTKPSNTEFNTIIDNLYLEYMPYQSIFMYIGKKNVKDGVGLASNPTDFIGESKPVDKTQKAEDRRNEREGSQLIGIDWLFNNTTLTAISLPNDSDFLFKGSFLIEEFNSDVSLHYFQSDIPGIGLNISSTVGDEWVFYSESALRWNGTKRKDIELIQDGIPKIYNFTTPSDANKKYLNLVLGGHYTFRDNTNIILEYILNGDGYSDAEWNRITDCLVYSSAQYKQNIASDLMKSNLLQINDLMDFGKMRQHYLFFRISNPDLLFKLNSSLVTLLNIQDGSYLINPLLSFDINPNLTIQTSGYIFIGSNTSEFGLMYWQNEITLGIKYFFL